MLWILSRSLEIIPMRFIGIDINMKGINRNRLDYLFLGNEKANDVNEFIDFDVY
jgi:hypothetical protein